MVWVMPLDKRRRTSDPAEVPDHTRAWLTWEQDCPRSDAGRGRAGRARFGLVLRGTLRHHPVRVHGEPVGREGALQHHFRFVLERVGHDAAVAGRDDGAFALDLEAVIEGVALPQDRVGDHVAVQLQLLPVPRIRLRAYFLHVLVVLGAFAQRRPEQAAEGQHQHARGETYPHKFAVHMLLPAQNTAGPGAGQPPSNARTGPRTGFGYCGAGETSSRTSRATSATGRPTTFV